MKITRVVPATESQNKKVAAYARVSTLKEAQEDSFEVQSAYFSSLINSTPEWDFVEVYADQGKSGRSAEKRPNFMRMINDAYAGKIDIILVKSVSRFGRNFRESQLYVHKLKEKNVEVRFEKEGVSSFDPQSEMVFDFLAAISEEESRSTAANVSWGYRKRLEQGERHIGSNHLMGFDEINGKLTPNQDAWIRKLVIEEYADGRSVAEIINHLHERGAKRMRSSEPFNPQIIYALLENPAAVGDRILQRRAPIDFVTKKPDNTKPYDSKYIKNDHPGVVDREVWDRAQERLRLERQGRKNGVYKTTKTNFMFGKIYCGECGELMTRRSIHYEGEMQKVWKCKDRNKGRKGNGCKCDVVSERDLFEAVFRFLGKTWS